MIHTIYYEQYCILVYTYIVLFIINWDFRNQQHSIELPVTVLVPISALLDPRKDQ